MYDPIIFSRSIVESDDIELLRYTIKRFQRIFNGTGYGFWEWNLDTQHIEWSGGFWERLGYGPEDLTDISDANKVISYMHPDDRDYAINAARIHLRDGKPLDITYRIRTKQGEYIWTQVRADSLRDESGHAYIMSGINFDITDIKKVESALRDSEARQIRIVQASNDGIWEWYPNRGGFHFSHRCWELLGYEDIDDVITNGEDKLKVWRTHIYPEDLHKFDNALSDHITAHAPFDVEYRLVNVLGEIRWVRARGKAIFDDRGNLEVMSGSNMDITEVKRAEEKVIQAKEVAERANKAKSQFLSSMSHELRTPLNAILGYTQLFSYDGNLNEEQLGSLREIRKAGEHLLQLINDVLDLAKIESGNMMVSLEPVLLSRIIPECLTLMQPQADARAIKLHTHLQDLDQNYVMADHIRIKQALLNLMSNAVKYNHVGGEVELSLHQSQLNRIRIQVKDTGQGIPLARQSEVFQPFNRLSAENSTIEGSGVGLVITKQLVEMMEGTISFVSGENAGSTFWIDLPLANDWNKDKSVVAPRFDEIYPDQLILEQRHRVLYIEDNHSNIRLMQQIFMRYPLLELDIAEEAFLGVYKARSMQFDVIILDINLPGMDGYQVLEVLKNDVITKDIPIIGLSANAMPYDIEKGKNSGFFDYLTKPVEINRLVSALSKILCSSES
jgi:PAS domain S-box-containing protein